ncbi:MAG: glycosyltransferase family 9 protein [Candidatus Latescibacteria bacterium]|nr:glycosyltransferase family 9 protein [Candidatus Latescibacterota bacterium]
MRIGKSGHLLVKRGGALGDFVLTLPAVAALRLAFPGSALHLVGDPRFYLLARPDAALDHNSPALIPLYTGNPLGPEAGPFYADCTFCLAYAVDPEGQLERRLRCLVAGEVLLWDPRPPAGCHITDHLLAPLRQRGLTIADPLPRFELLAPERQYARTCREERQLRSPLVLIHPGSGGRRKCWPLDRYLALARWCMRQGCEVLLLHGPADTDLGELLSAEADWRDRALCPPGPLELASLLESAALFIGNDSGPGHLAAALGTPTLSLFGPTDPRVWRPPHPRARVVQAPDGELARLEVATVAGAAGEMLGGGSTGRP